MKNLWREKVVKGERTVGFFLSNGDASTAELAGLSQMDYIIIDTEHGPFDVETVATMVRSMELHHSTTLVDRKSVV